MFPMFYGMGRRDKIAQFRFIILCGSDKRKHSMNPLPRSIKIIVRVCN